MIILGSRENTIRLHSHPALFVFAVNDTCSQQQRPPVYRHTISGFLDSALQPPGLALHVFDHHIVDIPLSCGIFQHLPGGIGVKMNLNQRLVTNGQQAVALDVCRNMVVYLIFREILPLDQQLRINR